MRPSSRSLSLAGLAVGTLFAVAACSSAASTPSSSVLGATSGPSALTLSSTTSATLGSYLTGKNGLTLYVFTKDGPDKSNCTGTCAATWPPLTVTAGATISGPSTATLMFGTITRPDGTTQVTYNHRPLYYFSGDAKAGDTNGQGILGIWFVADVSGSVAGAGSPAPSATTAGGSSGLALTETTTSLGTFLTGRNGMTLYYFTKDSPDKSVCTGQCASLWPALTVPAGTSVSGPSDAMAGFATITLADGSMQVTYNHRPLYYYSGDAKAGDTNGQGFGGVWFVALVSGSVSSAAPAGGATQPTPAPTSAYGY
jgi:predicted lipoprotein with Yx(FWY)xxD motif